MDWFFALLTSRSGQIIVAFLIGGTIGWWKTDASWERWEKAQDADRQVLHQMELAREAQNAVEIATAATQRAEDDAAALSKLEKQIVDFDKGEANAKDPCLIDDAFHAAAGRLRQPIKPARPARVTRPTK